VGGLGTYVTYHKLLSFFLIFVNIVHYPAVRRNVIVPPCVFVSMCIIGHYGNRRLDADGDDGDDHFSGQYVVSVENFSLNLNFKNRTTESAVLLLN